MSSSAGSGVRSITLYLLAVLLLSACGHEPVRRLPGSYSQTPDEGEQAAIVAIAQVGVPYRYGGSTTKGFDCSGLVQYAWSHAGTRIPRTTGAQWQSLAPVNDRDLRPGDILFFRIDGSISHVGLYVGDGQFVHAPSSGREVSLASLSARFYRDAFIRGGRPD